MCFFKKFRRLNAENLGSVGQKVAKLLAVKVGGLKKKSATQAPAPLEPIGPHSRTPGVESFSNFDGL